VTQPETAAPRCSANLTRAGHPLAIYCGPTAEWQAPPTSRRASPWERLPKQALSRWPGRSKSAWTLPKAVGRDDSWTRIWRRLFRRHEYFLAQTDRQAIALTSALPQVQQLWEMPRIAGYLDRFASATQQMGHVLRD
jgi:hypothetical protein